MYAPVALYLRSRLGWRALICFVVTLGMSIAQADDAGMHAFLTSESGRSPAAVPTASFAPRENVPLTVRPRRRPKFAIASRRSSSPAPVASIPQFRVGKGTAVSLFEDRTLRRGDAVMTAKGLRIFAGSRSFPYAEADFVALSDADWVQRGQRESLRAFDYMSQG